MGVSKRREYRLSWHDRRRAVSSTSPPTLPRAYHLGDDGADTFAFDVVSFPVLRCRGGMNKWNRPDPKQTSRRIDRSVPPLFDVASRIVISCSPFPQGSKPNRDIFAVACRERHHSDGSVDKSLIRYPYFISLGRYIASCSHVGA